MARKPSVDTNPIANSYSSSTERIIEFTSGVPGGPGGLISLVRREDGSLSVNIYRLDENVTVTVSDAERS